MPAAAEAIAGNTSGTRVLVICPYPLGSVPGQRFRYEQYLEELRRRGFSIEIEPFLSAEAMAVLYRPGHIWVKSLDVLRGFGRRLRLLVRARQYDFVFIYREASPLGPPLVEWALFVMRCKVIYDFDDAIFITPRSEANPLMAYVRCAWKVSFITRRAHIVSVCNPFLLDWARAQNPHVALIPTTIDETYHRPPEVRTPSPRPIIGWTGSHSTARYLDLVRAALVELQQRHDFEFRVICDRDPGFPELKHYRFIKWQLATEISDLSAIQIGLMPVAAEDWASGKVGFKAIQYSALGIPPVASAFGSGGEVVVDGETGLLVQNDTDAWVRALEQLLADPEKARHMGENARAFILKKYSVGANLSNYLTLFEA